MIDISPYPNSVAQILEYKEFDKSKIKELPTKTIIRISGLAGSGKGTLSKLLCDQLDLVNLETSYILRTATYIYETLGLDYSEENTRKVYDQIEISLPGKALEFRWNDVLLTDTEIRSNIVQANVARYSGIPFFRELYYNKIGFILNNLISSPVILDGRGFNTPYINQAKEDGFNVICLFFWVDDKCNYDRYSSAYLARHSVAIFTPEIEDKISAEFKKNILERNYQDYLNAQENNLGAVIPGSFVVNTTGLSPNQVLEIVLNKVFE